MSAETAAASDLNRSPTDFGSEAELRRLHDIISSKSLLVGDFTLSSGRKSHYLFQLRQTTMLPEGQYLIGNMIARFMREHSLNAVGGLELGAIPVVCAAAFASHVMDYPIDSFFIRKQAKEHGAKERIGGEFRPGADILMVDDVTTTGASTLKAVEAAQEVAPCSVKFALSIIDREEGAAEFLREHGIELVSLLKKSDFEIRGKAD